MAAATSATRSYKVDRLTDTNYQPWRMKMEILLEKQDLLTIADGTTLQPDPADVAAVAAWKKRDLSARLELLLHMEDAQTQAVRTLTTAHDIWKRLESTYERKDVSAQVNLLKKLITLTVEDTSDIAKFTRIWRLALDDILISGLALPENVQAVLLLAALPQSWQSFI
ncbi:hypothetical protein L7F22_036448 [Adiantum nelumboides]|nr:hypothetical protein [Adiantum nelumboides]